MMSRTLAFLVVVVSSYQCASVRILRSELELRDLEDLEWNPLKLFKKDFCAEELGISEEEFILMAASAQAHESLGQCMGTSEEDTYLKLKSCASASGSQVDCPVDLQPWRKCTWPFKGDEFAKIGQGNFFDFSHAVKAFPEDHLLGIEDYSVATRREILKDGVRVLHDLDDTVFCSGGSFPKGVDQECWGTESHGLYPGVAEMFYALSLGYEQNVEWGVTKASASVPFSARPSALRALLGMKKCVAQDLEIRKRLCGCSGRTACAANAPECSCFGMDDELAQYGKTGDAKDFVHQDQFGRLGFSKYENWMKLMSKLTPLGKPVLDKPVVFIGDNGQGDLVAAQMMLIASQQFRSQMTRLTRKGLREPGVVVAAFIHDVRRVCQSEECRQAWAKHNIFFFKNYGEAAEIAGVVGLIPDDLVLKVVEVVDRESGKISTHAECQSWGLWHDWSDWSEMSQCPVTCGGGKTVTERRRTARHRLNCPEREEKFANCAETACPADN